MRIISSSSANISDELSIQQSVLLALVLRDETHAGHNHQDEDEGEEKFDEIGTVSRALSWGLKLSHIKATLRLELTCSERERTLPSC
jgi:hypothetical protein